MAEAEAQLVNHVPDELSVQVRAPASTDPAALYEQVRRALNTFAQDPPADASDADENLAHDLRPRALMAARGTELVLPLGRHPSPWVPWEGEEGLWHCYYQLGAQRVSFAQAEQRRASEQRVRELTNLLNSAGGPTGNGWSVVGGSANWIASGLPFSCGSPASLPLPTSQPIREVVFRFGERAQTELSAAPGAQRARVIVAILDTCPTKLDDLGNPHLRELLGKLQIDPLRAGDSFDSPLLPWWQEDMPEDAMSRPAFAMPDHGLFVAGIVHSIAPDVELHLLPVLNEFGIGDQFALERVMRSLPDLLLRNAPDARLIVNLSLGSAIPVPRGRYWRRWLPESHRRANASWPDDGANKLLEGAHQNLRNTVQWLHDQGVLVVAAAGNDGLRHHNHGHPPVPRYPAYYEPVLAVAAAVEGGQAADYSNRGDVKPYGNGVTTFGGRVVPSGRSDQPARTAEEGSILGLCSSPSLAGGAENRTGWVRWAGTSFSTPIVAAFAARLWQQNATQTPQSLMRRIRACARDVPSGQPAGNDPDGPLDAPYLEAWQEVR